MRSTHSSATSSERQAAQLAQARPDAFLPVLAMSLNLGMIYSELGRREDALSPPKRLSTFVAGWRMRYLHDAKLRDRIQLQLNRGEGRHALTKRLFFGTDGVFRTGEADLLMNKVSALSVLSNAVLIWNTTRMTEIVGALEATAGQKVPVDDLARISPSSHC